MIFYHVIRILILKINFSLFVSDDITASGFEKITCCNFPIRIFLSLSTLFLRLIVLKMRERKSLVHCVQNDLKKIAKRSDFKNKV